MIRVWLLVALVACSKSPRATHEDVPRTHDGANAALPIDAQVVDAQVVDAQVVDAHVFDASPVVDAQTVDAKPRIDAGIKPTAKLGKVGDICAYGSRGADTEDPTPKRGELPKCGPGLICCYPCGIQGCDSICKKSCPAVP